MNKRTQHEDIMTLTFQIARQMRNHFGGSVPEKGAEGISHYQIHVLFALLHHASTMGELAAEMNITLPSATAVVDRLVKNGWVVRQPDERDRRITRLSVTEEGRKVCQGMKQKRYKAFSYLLEAMPESDVESLHRIFTNLLQTLEGTKAKKEL